MDVSFAVVVNREPVSVGDVLSVGEQDAGAFRGSQDHRPAGGASVRGRFIAIDSDLDGLVAPALVLPVAADLDIELVFDAPPREAGGILSSGGGRVERDALGAVLLDYYGVVGVRLEEKAGVRELQVPGREAPRSLKGRAARGWKPAVKDLADFDIEVVALGVLGDHDHAGQRVAVRGAGRVEELRMGFAAGADAIIGASPDVADEDARGLRLRRHRPEEHAAQRQQGDEQQWERRDAPRGGED